jgi:general L-amino acid transport system permease protein
MSSASLSPGSAPETVAYVAKEKLPTLPPPAGVAVSFWQRQLKTYFGTPFNAAMTIVCILFVVWAAPLLFGWAFWNAVWSGEANACRAEGAGACWAFVREKFWFSIFGLYPYELRWRPAIVMAIFAVMVAITVQRCFWRAEIFYAWLVALVAMWTIQGGVIPVLGIGIPGLEPVPSRLWGGVLITIFLAVFGLAVAFPIGILLALGRRSNMPVVKAFCIAWIEFIRGVPLISLLFIVTFILPLFLAPGVDIDRFLRAQIAFIIFAAAYLAEVFRGGLQAIPKGQYEAADAMGLGYWAKMSFIVLPQALKITIPAQVNTFIGLFKDTTLVVIIGIFDFFTTLRAALGDANWLGFATEAYVYAAVVYFIACFGMSRYSQKLEVTLSPERRR